MKGQLAKLIQRKQSAVMIYISKTGEISKRRIRVLKIEHNSFTAYCFTKQAIRTFKIDQILSLFPVFRQNGREAG